MVPGNPSAPPNPVEADGEPGTKVVSVGGSGADFTDHSSASPLTHQVGAGDGFGGAFSGKSAASAPPNAPEVNSAATIQASVFKEIFQG